MPGELGAQTSSIAFSLGHVCPAQGSGSMAKPKNGGLGVPISMNNNRARHGVLLVSKAHCNAAKPP